MGWELAGALARLDTCAQALLRTQLPPRPPCLSLFTSFLKPASSPCQDYWAGGMGTVGCPAAPWL